MHKLATVSYTVSQCGRKVCFITSLYSQVTRPCFLKEKKKSLHQTEDIDEREILGGFCLPLTKVAHLLLQQILSCSLGEKKSILKNLIDLQSMHPRYLEIVIRTDALKEAYSP